MSSSFISTLKNARLLMRSIASMVIIAHFKLITTPAVAAVKIEQEKQTSKAALIAHQNNDAEIQLAKTLQAIEFQLQQIINIPIQLHVLRSQSQQLKKAKTDNILQIKNLQQQLITQGKQVQSNFEQIATELLDRQLPQVILDRHQQTVNHYRANMTQILKDLDDVIRAKDNNTRQKKAHQVMALFKANKRSHQQFDPKQMPFKIEKNAVRKPKDTVEELQKVILKKSIPMAELELAAKMLVQVTNPGITTPHSSDLEPTEDVQITQAIKTLATELEYHPVKIYNWVHNNIEYLPTYGSIQGSQLTLDNQRGNAFDTASLLIALLRASNIPARYVYGTVQIPIEKVMNWVGGVESPQSALEVMGQGGIPVTAIIQGSEIKYAKLEHIWVEGWVDYVPSRAAKNQIGDSWIAMDASFKQYDITQGMDLKNAVPFDHQRLLELVTQTAEINEQEGSITGMDQNLIQTTLDDYRTQVSTYIEQTASNASVGDIIGNKKIQKKQYPILASGLPYKLLESAGNISVLPTNLRHHITFNLYASATDQALNNPVLTHQTSLPKLNDQRVSFAYEPSTEADQAVLDTAYENYQTKFAAYLVNMTPKLIIGDQTVAVGGSYTVGTDQILSVAIQTPWYTHPRNYQVTSGDSWVLGVNPAGITSQLFDKRTLDNDLSETDQPDYLAEMFHQIILGYWAQLNAYNALIATRDEIISHQLPSHGLAGAPVSIAYSFGIPRWASYKTRSLDVKENLVSGWCA